MATVSSPDVLPVVAPANHVAGPPQGQWTYSAYAALPDDGQRYEVIAGVLYMAPAPTDTHQAASTWFIYYLTAHVQVPGYRPRLWSTVRRADARREYGAAGCHGGT